MRTVLYYLTLLIGCLLIGCNSLKQEVNPDKLIAEPAKLVVACFISPQDTVLAARVSISQPVLGLVEFSSTEIPNATVTLSDGKQTIQLLYTKEINGGNGYYRADVRQLPVTVGQTYTLTAKTANGRLAVDASCTVPGPVPIESITLDSSLTRIYSFARMEYYARLRWRDPAGQTNYYRIAGKNDYSRRMLISNTPNGPYRDSLVQIRGDWSFNISPLLTDVGRDGGEFVSPQGRLANTNPGSAGGAASNDRPRGYVAAYLLNVDENYYRYHDEVDRQSKVRNNPFAEPVLIQTNIRGGLGCFGAYNKSTLVAELK